eukprot:5560892-Amphidinium_carterae.1
MAWPRGIALAERFWMGGQFQLYLRNARKSRKKFSEMGLPHSLHSLCLTSSLGTKTSRPRGFNETCLNLSSQALRLPLQTSDNDCRADCQILTDWGLPLGD